MVSAVVIEILRCPETMQKIRQLSADELQECNRRIAIGEIFSRSGTRRGESLQAALIREDGLLLFQILNGIPVMLLEEALVLGGESR